MVATIEYVIKRRVVKLSEESSIQLPSRAKAITILPFWWKQAGDPIYEEHKLEILWLEPK